jgi:outer membrane receptor protein involved in Fe transport
VIYYGDRITHGLYANDNWKISKNVTANLGVRWEYQTLPYTERLLPMNAVSNVPGLITFGSNYDVLYDNLGRLSLPLQDSITVD